MLRSIRGWRVGQPLWQAEALEPQNSRTVPFEAIRQPRPLPTRYPTDTLEAYEPLLFRHETATDPLPQAASP